MSGLRGLTNSKGAPTASREFAAFIKAIGECKSRAEEDRIVRKERDALKQVLTSGRVDRSRMRELMTRLIYVEMLGHDASFGHFAAVKLCSDPSLLNKKAGYLASTALLAPQHELTILLINTIQRDLASDNFVVVATALDAVCKLASNETVPALMSHVTGLVDHRQELVRKKVALALQRFIQLSPENISSVDQYLRKLLCDREPPVMAAALNALHDAALADAGALRPLVPSFVSVLKQVIEGRLPKHTEYRKMPAPFIQARILRILSLLCAGDRGASEHAYHVLTDCMRRARLGNTISNAILYECIRTAARLYPSAATLSAATDAVGRFLAPGANANLRYAGIRSLIELLPAAPQAAERHQVAVIDCLEAHDASLQAVTLELLGRMATPDNVEPIVEKMLEYMRTCADESALHDVATRLVGLAERFAPSLSWHLEVTTEALSLVGEEHGGPLAHKLREVLAQGVTQDPSLAEAAVELYLPWVHRAHPPEHLLRVVCWALGEFGACSPAPCRDALCDVLASRTTSETVTSLALSGLAKVCSACDLTLPTAATETLSSLTRARSTDLQLRALQLQAALAAPPAVKKAVAPNDGTEATLRSDNGAQDILAFLDSYVNAALQNGAKPYRKPAPRDAADRLAGHELKFDAGAAGAPAASAPTRAPPAGSGNLWGDDPTADHKKKLAASLFGGRTDSGARSAAVPAARPKPAAQPVVQDLLDLGMDEPAPGAPEAEGSVAPATADPLGELAGVGAAPAPPQIAGADRSRPLDLGDLLGDKTGAMQSVESMPGGVVGQPAAAPGAFPGAPGMFAQPQMGYGAQGLGGAPQPPVSTAGADTRRSTGAAASGRAGAGRGGMAMRGGPAAGGKKDPFADLLG
ncbi:unnamed protein product [Pedinophyceae sp. YPF-701]|nr:unnamed protein product [Pedinophyceae sp. YPF-701]